MLLTVALMGRGCRLGVGVYRSQFDQRCAIGGQSPQRVRVERGAITPTISFPAVVALVDHGRPVVVASVSPTSMYRFAHGVHAVRAQLQRGPGPQACVEVQVPGPAGHATRPGGVVRCTLPRGSAAVVGQPGTVAVTLRGRVGVLVLPLEAVAGSVQKGQVTVVGSGGATSVVTVGLGATDGSSIEITSGLHRGELVQLPAPVLPGFNSPEGG